MTVMERETQQRMGRGSQSAFFKALNTGLSIWATAVRLGSGGYVVPLGVRPAEPLTLYGRENCPFTRKVREALSMLDLDVMVYPCPENGARYRPDLYAQGGRTVPFLVDENTGLSFSGSEAMVAYLFQTYGRGKVPWQLSLGGLTEISSQLASYLRLEVGLLARASRAPDRPLELFGYEASPYCRFVRELFDILEMPCLVRNLAPGSPRRAAFKRTTGRMQVPFFVDPNTGVRMWNSRAIIRYVNGEYGSPAPRQLPARFEHAKAAA